MVSMFQSSLICPCGVCNFYHEGVHRAEEFHSNWCCPSSNNTCLSTTSSCNNKCRDGYYHCISEDRCISLLHVCDGDISCKDGSDELRTVCEDEGWRGENCNLLGQEARRCTGGQNSFLGALHTFICLAP